MSSGLVKIKDGEFSKIRRNFDRIKSNLFGPKASPTFSGLTITSLTASRLIWADASKALASKDLIDLVAGTANEVNVADDGSGGIIVGIVDPLIVAKGGTGLATITDGGLMLGSGTGAITALAQATNGQLPIGSTGVDPVLAGLTGTTDHITVTNGAGSITLDLGSNTQTLLDSFNGTFLETIDFTISESGGTVTGSLEQDGGGDLIQRFSDGYSTLDCTPATTIDLTAYVGTDTVPKEVFVYILQSAKTTIAASNSDWPATEHIKIANLLLRSAATTGTDGALVNRNWNDHSQSSDSQGHITHIEERVRQENAQYKSGIALTLKDSGGSVLTTGNSSTAVELVTTAGNVYQLHKQTFPATDMYVTATDDAHIVNQPTDEGGAYETTVDLVTDVTHYVDGSAAGVAIGANKYFNLVIWGVQNRAGEASHIMINLPTGQYTVEANATSDIDGYSVYDIPSAFKGTGFLIARLTLRLIAGPQWTYVAQEDLRGLTPAASAGVGVSTTDHALLANLTFATAGHTGFQAQGDVLDDLNTLGANSADGELIVGTGAGALAWESGATLRTSIGVGTGDTLQLTAIELGHVTDTTLTRVSAGVVAIEGTNIAMVGGSHHDGFSDFVANEHIDHTTVTLTAGVGLSGGGDISANRTFTIDLNELTTEVSIAAGDFITMVDITDSGSGKITFANLEAALNHDSLTGFVANEHIDHTTVTLTAGTGLTGGGDISANRSFAVDGVLEDLDTLGVAASDGQFIVATGAGAFAYESGATARASLGLIIGTDVLAQQTIGIADNNLVEIDDADAADNDYAKFTANGLEGRSYAEVKTDLSLNLVENTALSTWAGTANIVTVGTIATGTWQATDVGIAYGGTGQSTAQAAIDALTNVSGATNEHVLTKDTASGNAIFKVSVGGGGAHAILDGSTHTDSVADGVTRGSIIYGNSTPKWDELVIGAANTFLGSDGTDLSYRTAAQVMASLSGAASAAFDWNGQDLTNGGVIFLTEQAAAEADVAGKGQFWIKTATPNTAHFVDDTGVEWQLGKCVQLVDTRTGSVIAVTGNIPHDDTIPQNTEGDEIMTRSITPKSTTDLLKIDVVVNIADDSASDHMTVALFQDTTANALACANITATGASYKHQLTFTYYMAAGTTSSTTFKVRAGADSTNITINGIGGSRKFGGVWYSSITITEIAA